MKTFYPIARYSPLAITLIIFLAPILLLPTLGVNLYYLSILAAIFIPLLIYSIYKLTYGLIITDEGLLIEKQLFRKTRELSVNEIIQIKKCHYFEPLARTMIPSYAYETPCLENGRYKKFPRYMLSDKIVDYLKTIKPDINIDSGIIQKIEQAHGGAYKLAVIIAVMFVVIFLLYFAISLLKF